MSARRRPAWAWLGLLLLAAASLRFAGLSRWDVWTDEVQTLHVGMGSEFREGPMYRTAPLNFWITGLALGGEEPDIFAARIPPFLFGVATVLLLYALAARWVGERAARFAGVVLALSMWHVYWSQNARHFALQTLLVLLALWAFLRYWREGRVVGLAALPLLLLAALFTHSSSGFYAAAIGLFVAGAWARAWRGGEAGGHRRFVAVALALAVPLAIYLPIYLDVGRYLLAHKVAWNPPWNVAGSLAFYIPPYLALPALAGLVFLARERDDLAGLLASLVCVPALLVVAASELTIASAAYCLSSMLAVALLVGVACDRLLARVPSGAGRWAMALVIGAVFASQLYDLAHYYFVYNGMKPRWREVGEHVAAHRSDDEMFLSAEADASAFYLEDMPIRWVQPLERRVGTADFPPDGVGGVWYAIYLTDSPILRYEARFMEHLRSRARLAATFPLHYGAKDLTIALFHERVAPPAAAGVGVSGPP